MLCLKCLFQGEMWIIFSLSALNNKVRDFVGIELQTLDTTGTVWPERQRLLEELGEQD